MREPANPSFRTPETRQPLRPSGHPPGDAESARVTRCRPSNAPPTDVPPLGTDSTHDIESKSAAWRRRRDHPGLRPAPGGSDPGIPGPAGPGRGRPPSRRTRGPGMATDSVPAQGSPTPPKTCHPIQDPLPLHQSTAPLIEGRQPHPRTHRQPRWDKLAIRRRTWGRGQVMGSGPGLDGWHCPGSPESAHSAFSFAHEGHPQLA